MADIDLSDLETKLPRIAKELERLPDAEELKKKLAQAGCVTTMKEIGLDADLKDLTLRLCPYVRRRLTLLRLSKLMQL